MLNSYLFWSSRLILVAEVLLYESTTKRTDLYLLPKKKFSFNFLTCRSVFRIGHYILVQIHHYWDFSKNGGNYQCRPRGTCSRHLWPETFQSMNRTNLDLKKVSRFQFFVSWHCTSNRIVVLFSVFTCVVSRVDLSPRAIPILVPNVQWVWTDTLLSPTWDKGQMLRQIFAQQTCSQNTLFFFR